MRKKNTLLYLDEVLVKLAKKTGLNISKITEDALRSHLKPIMSCGERQLDFEGHLEDLKEKGECYLLPVSIKEVLLENIGKFSRLGISFDPGVNIIFGSYGSGKTSIIQSIGRCLHYNPNKHIFKHLEIKGRIKIIFAPDPNDITIEYKRIGDFIQVNETARCILLDEPVFSLDLEGKKEFIEWIKRRFNSQVIMTMSGRDIESIRLGKDDRVINLDKVSV